jgi:hypothetical protein
LNNKGKDSVVLVVVRSGYDGCPSVVVKWPRGWSDWAFFWLLFGLILVFHHGKNLLSFVHVS